MEIDSKDLRTLAVLVSKTVQSVAFPEDFMHVNYSRKVVNLIDTLEDKYTGAEMLGTVRNAMNNIATDKPGFYAVAKDLLRQVNAPNGEHSIPSAVTFTPMLDNTAYVSPLRMAG